MSQTLRFLICNTMQSGTRQFGFRNECMTTRDDTHGCRSYVCKDAAEFMQHMEKVIPKTTGLWGMVEVYNPAEPDKTKQRRAVKAGEVFTLSATAEAAPVILPEGTSAPVHPVAASGSADLSGSAPAGAAGEIEAESGEPSAESQAPEGAPTLLERIEIAVADKAKTYATLADELGVEVAEVKEAVKGQAHLQITGGWVKIVKE